MHVKKKKNAFFEQMDGGADGNEAIKLEGGAAGADGEEEMKALYRQAETSGRRRTFAKKGKIQLLASVTNVKLHNVEAQARPGAQDPSLGSRSLDSPTPAGDSAMLGGVASRTQQEDTRVN
jgi:hypothetical protein